MTTEKKENGNTADDGTFCTRHREKTRRVRVFCIYSSFNFLSKFLSSQLQETIHYCCQFVQQKTFEIRGKWTLLHLSLSYLAGAKRQNVWAKVDFGGLCICVQAREAAIRDLVNRSMQLPSRLFSSSIYLARAQFQSLTALSFEIKFTKLLVRAFYSNTN